MAANVPYSYSSTPIMEGWLIKALRLAHSKKREDLERLRKLYKEACDDEVQVSRITVAEALREPRDPPKSDTPEREPSQSGSTRVRPVLVITEPQQPLQESNTTSSSNPPSPLPLVTTVTPKTVKRTKVAFFNIFDPISSSSVSPSALRISTPAVQRTNELSTESVPVTVDLTESCSSSSATTCRAGSSTLTDPAVILSWSSTSTDLSTTSVIDLTAPRESTTATPDAHLVASLVADLACCACGKLTRPPQLEADGQTMNANMLVECVQCGALYHQMCHQPPVSSARPFDQTDWRCSGCQASASAPLDSSSNPMVLVEPITTTANLNAGARKRKGGLPSPAFAASAGFKNL